MVEKTAKEIEQLSFEQSLSELEKIVRELESGSITLDNAITSYEKGSLLKKHCEQKLKEAKMKVEKISLSTDNTPKLEEFDIAEGKN